MLRFSDFCKKQPTIQLGLDKGGGLCEDTLPFYGFIGSDAPEGTHIGNGVFDIGDGFVHNTGSKAVKFKTEEAANEFAAVKKKKFREALRDAHEEAVGQFDYTPDEKQSIFHYTDHLPDINHKLILGLELKPHEQKAIGALDSTIDNHKAHRDLEVYSGTNHNHADVLRKGGVVNHPGYISTSLNINGAKQFAVSKGGDIVKIHIPKGHPVAYAGGISGYGGEHEYILPRGTNLRIHPDKEQKLVTDSGVHTIHHATIEE